MSFLAPHEAFPFPLVGLWPAKSEPEAAGRAFKRWVDGDLGLGCSSGFMLVVWVVEA